MAESQATYCPRDPGTETKLRCGRCEELICPNCLIQTDVGSRCPDCARVRTPPMFQASSGELGKAVVAGFGTALGVAILASAAMLIFPLPFGGGAVAVGGIGWLVGEVVYRASDYKQSQTLQWVGGLATFSGFLIVSFVDPLGAIIGLIIGTYYAIQRLKPPRGI
ncbi:MAG: hypothetical protein QF554_01060 [Dehalococcoidia bacterium]|jgi:hypothetical protein|nr:hypothetical protein [Dehalococcoidia bacterium]